MRTLRLSVAMTAMLALLATPTTALAQEDGTAEPVGGVLTGVMVNDYENPMGCADWVLPDGSTMPAPTHMSAVTGVITPLGPATMTASTCYSTVDMFENVVDGEWAIVGEGEDGLSGTYDGNCIPDLSMVPGGTWECFGEFTITGGTGVYEGASGRLMGVATYMDTGFTDEGQMRAVPSEWRLEGIVES